MSDYDDGAYYEVQLNNKQLVFFFMAALAIAVVVFLCGVMVGRGVRDATLAASQNDIAASSMRAVADGLRGQNAAAAAPKLDYAERLEADSVEAKLDVVRSESPETTARERQSAEPTPALKIETQSAPAPAPPPAPAPAPALRKTIGDEKGTFTIQVVALKTEEAARALLARLQGKSYRAYLEAGNDAGLHRVRVGRFATRAEAERVAARLRDEEQFRPYITQ